MPLYKVTDTEAPKGTKARLVEATSKAAALRHVAGTRYEVATMESPVEVGQLMRDGVTMETAGEPAQDASGSEDEAK